MAENPGTEVVKRPWKTSRLPELIARKEAAAICGVTVMQLNRWLTPGSGRGSGNGPDDTWFIPPARTSAGPVWVKSDVVRWEQEYGRIRAPAGQGGQTK